MLHLPESYNYIGVFLSFRCPYTCSYCINRSGKNARLNYEEILGWEWVKCFEKLETGDVPITFQGGEPGLHSDFVEIVKELSEHHSVDILSNLVFDLKKFANRVDPEKMNRSGPYAPIRVSYHPDQYSFTEILRKVRYLHDAGFEIGLYGVLHPKQLVEIEHAKAVCDDLGIDFRTKPFLGEIKGEMYGEYAYPGACAGNATEECECAPSELLVAPDGSVHSCHHHLYNHLKPIAYLMDEDLSITDNFSKCGYYGCCNPCDVKIKNNRFQEFGHVSVKIRRDVA